MLRVQAISCAQDTQSCDACSALSHACTHGGNAYRARMAANPIYADMHAILEGRLTLKKEIESEAGD